MNERIQTLLAKFKETESTHRGAHVLIGSDEIEKFAELIVQECIKVVDDTITENQEMNIGLVMASAAIVSHFGVE